MRWPVPKSNQIDPIFVLFAFQIDRMNIITTLYPISKVASIWIVVISHVRLNVIIECTNTEFNMQMMFKKENNSTMKKKIGLKRRLNLDRIRVYFMSGNYMKTAIIYECWMVKQQQNWRCHNEIISFFFRSRLCCLSYNFDGKDLISVHFTLTLCWL